MPQEVHLFIAYAAADAALIEPLLAQLRVLQEQHGYFFFETQRPADLEENLRLLERSDEVVIFLSRAYLRDPFYRECLRRHPERAAGRRIRLLWTEADPREVSNEPFLHLHAPPKEERVVLSQVRRLGRLDEFYAGLVADWAGGAWRQFRDKEHHHQLALAEQARRDAEAHRRQARLRGIVSAAGMAALLFVIFYPSPRLPSPETPLMADSEPREPPPGLLPPEPATPEAVPAEPALPQAATEPGEPAPATATPRRETDAAGLPPSGGDGRYVEYHALGENRFAGLLPGRIGWQLLDAGGRPVTGLRFRRMYYREGFVDGRLKVKLGEEVFYVDPRGRRVE